MRAAQMGRGGQSEQRGGMWVCEASTEAWSGASLTLGLGTLGLPSGEPV